MPISKFHVRRVGEAIPFEPNPNWGLITVGAYHYSIVGGRARSYVNGNPEYLWSDIKSEFHWDDMPSEDKAALRALEI